MSEYTVLLSVSKLEKFKAPLILTIFIQAIFDSNSIHLK